MIENVESSSWTVPDILVRFESNLSFLHKFSKKYSKSNFMKIRPVRTELLNADGRTDMTKLIVAFRNFANEPND
jgi:hypothetical protein